MSAQEGAGVRCGVCPRGCLLAEGETGACRARGCADGAIISLNYGKLTGLALDPIEKKPLAFFHPGSRILSVGSFGCNLRCPFCQNHEISQAGAADGGEAPCREDGAPLPFRAMSPEELCALALELGERDGNIGVAFTYNEPLVGWEYVRDAARFVRAAGMRNVLVTNGCVSDAVLDAVLPLVDAANIDLKAFTDAGYARLGGSLACVKHTIARAAGVCHVEVTSLIVPGRNDSADEMEAEAAWLAGIDPDLALHITRYFPRYRMAEPPTAIARMEELQKAARRHLRRVLLGNI